MATAGENFYSYFDRERREAAKLKVPAFTESGTTSTPKAPDNEEEENELKKSKLEKKPSLPNFYLELKKKCYSLLSNCYVQSELKKIPAKLQYSLDDLACMLRLLPEDSVLYHKIDYHISCITERREAAKLKVPAFTKPGTTSTPKAPDNEEEEIRLKVPKPDERCFFSDLTEEQLMPSFGELRKFRFVLCKVFLSYNSVDAKARRVYKRHLSSIAAKLYVTTDNVVDMGTLEEYYSCFRRAPEQFNDAFEICNDCGYKLVRLSCQETQWRKQKVAGRVMAYYGKNFDYGCSPAEVDDYKAMLFESKQPEVKPGKINLMRPVLVGCIKGNDCSLELTVDWKLPPFSEETTLAKRSYYSDLTEKQISSKQLRKKWVDGSLQTDISLAFGRPVNGSFRSFPHKVSVIISTGTEADDCDYLCTSFLNIWPEIKSRSGIDGPKRARLAIKDAIDDLPQAGMLERCVSIFMMLERGILTWAPKLPIKTAIIHILPRNIAKKMHMDHLQSTIIGDALDNVLEYSRVRVRRRFHYGDYLDIEVRVVGLAV
ncbi:anticodon-binding aminoacyl-tRNA synthetase, class 1a [Tanacetum coccineum]